MNRIGALLAVSLLSYYVSFSQCTTKDCMIPTIRQSLANHKWSPNISFSIYAQTDGYGLAAYIGLSQNEMANRNFINDTAYKTAVHIAKAVKNVTGLVKGVGIAIFLFDRSIYIVGPIHLFKGIVDDGMLASWDHVPSDENVNNTVSKMYDLNQREMLRGFKLSQNQFLIHCFNDDPGKNMGTFTGLCLVNIVDNINAFKVGNHKHFLGDIAKYLKPGGHYKTLILQFRSKYNNDDVKNYVFPIRNGSSGIQY